MQIIQPPNDFGTSISFIILLLEKKSLVFLKSLIIEIPSFDSTGFGFTTQSLLNRLGLSDQGPGSFSCPYCSQVGGFGWIFGSLFPYLGRIWGIRTHRTRKF
jgi:hypothetical protein